VVETRRPSIIFARDRTEPAVPIGVSLGNNPGVPPVSLTAPAKPTRNHIEHRDVKHWAKHWNVSPEQIRGAIEKTGNSVAAVEKQLSQQNLGKAKPR
jgi:Protein of unknown function (DUF3606)